MFSEFNSIVIINPTLTSAEFCAPAVFSYINIKKNYAI